MSDYLRIAVTFLDPRFHGRSDGDEPEWPPSPLRLMQAIVAANSDAISTDGNLDHALAWLESQDPPLIVAPRGEVAMPYCLSVPNNAMDIVGRAWLRGNYFGIDGKGKYFGKTDANPATHRTMKTIRPMRMIEGDTIHYLWKLDEASPIDAVPIESLTRAAGRIVALGWGIDLVVGCAERISSVQLCELAGERWLPAASTNVAALRTPVSGTLAALQKRHDSFLDRIGKSGFTPVEPLTRFKVTGYRQPSDPITRPHAVFELKHDNGEFCRYPQRKLMHIAGMVRHLAKEAMLRSPPTGVPDGWVEQYVAGHRDKGAEEHRQFSYLPLPSIGHKYADQAVRRVMIAAPVGDDVWLKHLARRLAGRQLEPEKGDEFGEAGPPTLVRVDHDKVARCYTAAANRWSSVTPVILPGHDDRKPAKTRRLIDRALKESGIDQPCTYEWSPVSRFRNSLSAHKYHKDRDSDKKRWQFDKVKAYLQSKTWVHLTLAFDEELQVPGPIAIGAGRHCGFGLMAESPR